MITSRTINKADLGAGLVVTLLGVVYFLETLRIQRIDEAIGPETLPALVGIGLIVFGLVLAVTALVPHKSTPEEVAASSIESLRDDTSESNEELMVESEGNQSVFAKVLSSRIGRLLINFGLFFVYVCIFVPIGFLISTFVFLFGMSTLYNPGKWLRNAIFGAAVSTILYFTFTKGLGVFLPVGILG